MPADRIPPAYPAPSPAGYSPLTLRLWKSSPRVMRRGDEVRVSTTGEYRVGQRESANLPVEGGNRLAQRSDRKIGQRRRQVGRVYARLVRGNHAAELGRGSPPQESLRRVALAPRTYHRRVRRHGLRACVGRQYRRAGPWLPPKSSGVILTTSAALALRSAREYWLMPLVTTQFGSEVAATTWPPGHMQKLYTARPLLA